MNLPTDTNSTDNKATIGKLTAAKTSNCTADKERLSHTARLTSEYKSPNLHN